MNIIGDSFNAMGDIIAGYDLPDEMDPNFEAHILSEIRATDSLDTLNAWCAVGISDNSLDIVMKAIEKRCQFKKKPIN